MSTTLDRPIMDQLRDETRGQHDRIERTAFAAALASGRLPREAYVESLAQLLVVHRALERHLRAAAGGGPSAHRDGGRAEPDGRGGGHCDARVRAVVREHQFQEANLRADLGHFGRDAEAIAAHRAALDLVEDIERTAAERPVGLLGHYYVLEGSKNGAKFLAPRVREAYRLVDGRGAAYLDPYGTEQRARWAEFRAAMNGLDLSEGERAEILRAAGATFTALTRMYDGLYDAPAGEAQRAATSNSE